MIETPERLLLRPEQAAQMLAISRARLYELLASGEVQSVKIGKLRRIPLWALQRFVEEQLGEQTGGQRDHE